MINMPYDFFRYLSVPPSSTKTVFSNIRRCISMLAPECLKRMKPSSEAEIQKLEWVVQTLYGTPLPPSFKMYLQQMGQNDDGLLSYMLEEYWDDFADGDLARGTRQWIEPEQAERAKNSTRERFDAPPYWLFYFGPISALGAGFSPVTDDPDQLIRVDGSKLLYTNDTLPKVLYFLTCLRAIRWTEEKYGHKRDYKTSIIQTDTWTTWSIELLADCPPEWKLEKMEPLREFLTRLEEQFSLRECWLSTGKTFCVLDTNHEPVPAGYIAPLFTRYVSINETNDLMFVVRVHFEWGSHRGEPTCVPQIQVNLYGDDTACIKGIMDELLSQSKPEEISMVKIENN